jgi:hypothetical protein
MGKKLIIEITKDPILKEKIRIQKELLELWNVP